MVCRIPEPQRRAVQCAPDVGAHDRLHLNALGTIRTEHAALGVAPSLKDGELLRLLKPVCSSITYHLLAPLRSRHLGRNGRPLSS